MACKSTTCTTQLQPIVIALVSNTVISGQVHCSTSELLTNWGVLGIFIILCTSPPSQNDFLEYLANLQSPTCTGISTAINLIFLRMWRQWSSASVWPLIDHSIKFVEQKRKFKIEIGVIYQSIDRQVAWLFWEKKTSCKCLCENQLYKCLCACECIFYIHNLQYRCDDVKNYVRSQKRLEPSLYSLPRVVVFSMGLLWQAEVHILLISIIRISYIINWICW